GSLDDTRAAQLADDIIFRPEGLSNWLNCANKLGLAAETPDLQPADQHKNEQDDQHQPEATGRAIAPTSTVPPPGQATNQQDDENDKKKSADGHASPPDAIKSPADLSKLSTVTG